MALAKTMTLRRTLKHIAFWLAVLLLAWPALAVLVAMPALEALLPKLYRDQTGRELQLGEVLLDPYQLRLTLRAAASADPDQRPFWSLREAMIDLSPASLWRRAIVLDSVRLDGLSLRVEQLAADRYNFSDILDFRAVHFPPTEPEDDGPLPPLELHRLELGIADLHATLPYLAEPLTAALTNLQLTIDDFTTRPEGFTPDSTADLPPLSTAALKLGFDRLQLQSLRSEEPWDSTIDRFSLGFDELTTVAEKGQPHQIEAQFADGGSLRWRGELSTAAHSSSGDIALDDVGLRPLWAYLQPQLNFRANAARNKLDLALHYRLNWRDGLSWAIDKGQLAIHDTDLKARDDADTELQLQKLGLDGISANSKSRQAAVERVRVDGLLLKSWNRDAAIGLLAMLQPRRSIAASAASTTPASAPAANSDAPWQLAVGELSGDDTRIRWRASQLDVEQVDINPLAFKLQQLHWPSTGMAQISVKATVNDTLQLSADGDLDPQKLDGKLHGSVDKLPLVWGNKLLGQQLALTIASGELATQWQLALADGAPTQLQADGGVSGFEIVRTGNKRKLAAWKQLQWRDLKFDLEKNALTLADVALQQPFLQFRLYEDGSTNFRDLAVAPTPAAVDRKAEAADEQPLQVAVTAIRIANGQLDFRDDTLPRPFRALIGELGGDILQISSAPGRYASVDLAGSVDGYAPVTLVGRVAPLADKPALDLTLDFANLDLATFTPYSSLYAGYLIDHGQLSVQLAYKLEQDRIEGRNRIVVDQLQLGEKVASPKALDLPLRLAIALLTDENGVMDLGVDISGNINDPEFDLGGIVWKAVRNVIVKAATAPFKLLANLVGSKQKLDFVAFAPGSEALDDRAQEKLNALRDALEQRPELRLMVSGQTEDGADSQALREQQRDDQLQEAGLSETQLAERGRAWRNALEDLYEKQQPDADPDDLTDAQLADAVRDGVVLRPTALRALAGRRALTIKRTLVTQLGLGAERVFIDSGKRQTVQQSRATLAVDAR